MAHRLTENRVAELRASDAKLEARLDMLEAENARLSAIVAALVAAHRASVGATLGALKLAEGRTAA